MGMELLVPIGRFSRMTRLSIKALRHYDRIGLLEPAKVDPSSGYRYYRYSQARQAEAIRLLRGVDMSLDDIATVLGDGTSEDVVAKVLQTHRDRLTEELAVRQRRLATVQRLINGEEPVMPYDITTKAVDPVTILGLRRHTTLAQIGEVIPEAMHTAHAAVAGSDTQMAGAPMVLYHDVIDEEQSGDIEVALPVASAVPLQGDLTCRTIEGGQVASTIHRGDYAEIGPAYHVLTGWMTEHGHTPGSPVREIYLNDPQELPPEEWLTEVQWPFE